VAASRSKENLFNLFCFANEAVRNNEKNLHLRNVGKNTTSTINISL
jgi:hypothetical protein